MKMAIINGNLVLVAETVDENFSLAEMELEAGLIGKLFNAAHWLILTMIFLTIIGVGW